jgi:uncharacterized membrane protein HdeD (DUF308 family)
MSEHVVTSPAPAGIRSAARDVTGQWWTWLAAGVAWGVIALVILQFDNASVTTVGVLAGTMFTLAAVQNFTLAALPGATRWVSAMFGVLFAVSAVVCFADPAGTFAGMADMLGFLFLIVGVWWMVRAFLEQPVQPLWWMGLIAGILMTVLAFWTAGQFFVEKAYLLLVLAGIWALMEGVNDITRAFALRRLHDAT